MIHGMSLASLDDTDIETLFDFIAYITAKNQRNNEQFVIINGKKYKKVDSFGNMGGDSTWQQRT